MAPRQRFGTPSFNWNDDAVATLRVLTAKGWSARLIAADFGITRNSVIGKWHRLKISNGVRPRKLAEVEMSTAIALPVEIKAPRPPRARPGKTAQPTLQFLALVEPAAPSLPPVVLPVCIEVTLADRKEGQCHYPTGRDSEGFQLYCGDARSYPSPYCTGHKEIMYGAGTSRERQVYPVRVKFKGFGARI